MKKRIVMLLSVVALMVGMLAMSVGPGFAAPGGNAANAAKCEEGGYLDYTDANRNPFKNEGQCTRYAAKGGQLVPTANISLDPVSGTISGTGFTPNSLLRIEQTWAPSGVTLTVVNIFSTDASGAFVIGPGWQFCENESTTGAQVTVTDSAGVSATEFLELSCGT